MAIIYEKMKNNLYSHQHAGTDFKGIDFEGFDFTGLDVRGFSFCEAININSSIVDAKKVDEAMFYYEQNGKKVKAYFDEDTFKTKEQIIWLMSQKTQKEKNKKLIKAAREGYTELVKLLLDAGADIEAKDKYGYTALIRAASNGYTEVVKLLLDAGADIEAKKENGDTALIRAASNGHTEVVKLLKQYGAIDPRKQQIFNERTKLMQAKTPDLKEFYKLLKIEDITEKEWGTVWFYRNKYCEFALYFYYDEPNILYLANVEVNKKYRRNGFGNYILEIAKKEAKKFNADYLRLRVVKDSWKHKWYKRHGYKDLEEDIYIDEDGIENIWMELKL
jgi:ribosomal protein S18 acetylase RimI-like enzyme